MERSREAFSMKHPKDSLLYRVVAVKRESFPAVQQARNRALPAFVEEESGTLKYLIRPKFPCHSKKTVPMDIDAIPCVRVINSFPEEPDNTIFILR